MEKLADCKMSQDGVSESESSENPALAHLSFDFCDRG